MKEIHDTPGRTVMPDAAERQEIQVPEGLEQRLSALVDRLEAEEEEAERLRRQEGMRRQNRRTLSKEGRWAAGKSMLGRWAAGRSMRGRWATGLAVAAVMAGLVFVALTPKGGGRVIEVNDPEEARIQTERALNLLASTLNKGVKGMEKAEQETAVFTERIRGLRR